VTPTGGISQDLLLSVLDDMKKLYCPGKEKRYDPQEHKHGAPQLGVVRLKYRRIQDISGNNDERYGQRKDQKGQDITNWPLYSA